MWLLPPALFLVAWIVLDLTGVAGLRFGFVVSAAALAVAGGASVAVLARRRPLSHLWYGVAALGAIVGAGLLLDRAAPGVGVLAAKLDGLQPPMYRLAAERRSGGPTCRPSCPALIRTYVSPPIGRRAIVLEWAQAFGAAGFGVDLPSAVQTPTGFRSEHDGVTASVAVAPEPDEEGSRRVTVRLSSE